MRIQIYNWDGVCLIWKWCLCESSSSNVRKNSALDCNKYFLNIYPLYSQVNRNIKVICSNAIWWFSVILHFCLKAEQTKIPRIAYCVASRLEKDWELSQYMLITVLQLSKLFSFRSLEHLTKRGQVFCEKSLRGCLANKKRRKKKKNANNFKNRLVLGRIKK